MTRILKLQPRQTDEHEPRPPAYLIDKDGNVGQQELWGGNPCRLIGFTEKPVLGTIDVTFRGFWHHSHRALNKFPIFEDSKNEWFVFLSPVEFISEKYAGFSRPIVEPTNLGQPLKRDKVEEVMRLRDSNPPLTFRKIADIMKSDLKTVYRWYKRGKKEVEKGDKKL